jgi:hypothetical protein
MSLRRVSSQGYARFPRNDHAMTTHPAFQIKPCEPSGIARNPLGLGRLAQTSVLNRDVGGSIAACLLQIWGVDPEQ